MPLRRGFGVHGGAAVADDPAGDGELVRDDGQSAGEGFEENDAERLAQRGVPEGVGAGVEARHFVGGKIGREGDACAERGARAGLEGGEVGG